MPYIDIMSFSGFEMETVYTVIIKQWEKQDSAYGNKHS